MQKFEFGAISLFECGQIFELHKQGLSQRAVAAEVGHSKTVIFSFLNVPEGYRTTKSSGRPQKEFHWVLTGGSIWLAVETWDDPPSKLSWFLVPNAIP